MQAVVADAMAGGAAGFASSASPTHNGDSGRPVPSRVADLAELRALLEPVKQCGRGVVALLPGGVFSNRRGLPAPARGGAAVHLDGAADGEGLPVSREGGRRARRGVGGRGRGVAAGVVPTARLPDEPVRAVHAQHAPHVRRADGQVQGGAGGGLPRPRLAGHGVGRRQREGGRVPAQLGRDLGGRVTRPPRAGRPPGGRARRGARLHAARRDARRLARRRPPVALLVGARQRRPRRHRLVAAAGQRPAGPGGLGCTRLAALRRLLLHRPAGQLGPRAWRHAARARRAQADRRARRRLRPARPGDGRGGQGGRPVRVRPRDCCPGAAAPPAATSRPTASA